MKHLLTLILLLISADLSAQNLTRVIDRSGCGLSIIHKSSIIALRAGEVGNPGKPQPLTFKVTEFPGKCYIADSAYLWWVVSYTADTPVNGSVEISNPENVRSTIPADLIGEEGTKCWEPLGEIGTRCYRANITSAITGNGSYSLKVNTGDLMTDGMTMIILYKDLSADFEGHMLINDGLITSSMDFQETMSGFDVCGAPDSASAIIVVSDMQKSLPGKFGIDVNGVTDSLSRDFWNSNIFSTKLYKSQPLSDFHLYGGFDCWSWIMTGLYFRTRTCASCPKNLLVSAGQDKQEICAGETVRLLATGNAPSYRWSSNPPGFVSTLRNPVVKPLVSTDYFLAGLTADGCAESRDTVHVTVHPLPDASIGGPKVFCRGDSALLYSLHYNDSDRLLWSTGDTTPATTIFQPGLYRLTIQNAFGCSATDSFDIASVDKPAASVTADGSLCSDRIVTLTANPDSNSYLWSTGEAGRQIKVEKPGIYKVIVENNAGCTDSASVEIFDKPRVSILLVGSPCSADNPVLKAAPADSGYAFAWSTGETTAQISPTKSGLYWLAAENSHGCRDTAFFEIFQSPAVSILGPDYICNGAESALRTNKQFISCLWNTGESSGEIIINKPGDYSVTVTDSNGCTATDSIHVREFEAGIQGIIDLDFGRVCSGQDYKASLTIINKEIESVKISEITLSGSPVFQIPALNGGLSLLPGASAELEIEFKPRHIGFYQDSLVVTAVEPCNKIYKSAIKGAAIARVLARVEDVESVVGTDVTLPVQFSLICGDEIPPESAYQADLTFDATALLPGVDQKTGVSDKGIISRLRVIGLIGKALEPAYFNAITLLADRDTTLLTIENFTYNNEFIETSTLDGHLILKGLCSRNLVRVLALRPLTLSVAPNPATGDESGIVIDGESVGMIELSIWTLEGTKLSSVMINKTTDRAAMTINLNDYPSGIYQVIAKTGESVVYGRLSVIR